MYRTARNLLLLLSLGALLIFGCSGDPSGRSYHVVAISDLHFNPLYDASLYPALAAADASQWASIFQGSSIKTPSPVGSDTNYPLLVLTLASLKQNLGTSPVILFTGDLLGHNIPQAFCSAYSQANAGPCPTLSQEQFMDETFAFVASEIRAAAGNVPVIYAVGNIDTYSGGYGPDTNFLTSNAGTVYSEFLNGSGDEQTFQNTFTNDGYYSAQPLGAGLLVIALNSNSFVAGVPSSASAGPELTWLDSQLSAAQAAGQHVWILMHVPPGANSQSTSMNAAEAGTPDWISDESAAMMWDSGNQAAFLQTLTQHPGVVTLILAGHTHMDEFRILPTGNVVEQLPGISPVFGNNPAYKILTISQDGFAATDYESLDYDLANSPAPAQFSDLYSLSGTYGLLGSLDNSLKRLYPRLIRSEHQRKKYSYYFASGSTAVNPTIRAPFNPINSLDWPIFACAISEMDEPDYIDCVDQY